MREINKPLVRRPEFPNHFFFVFLQFLCSFFSILISNYLRV